MPSKALTKLLCHWADFFKAIGKTTIGGSVTVDGYIASGDVVVTQGQYTATVRTSGAKIDAPIAHVFTLRGGKVTSWKGYGDWWCEWHSRLVVFHSRLVLRTHEVLPHLQGSTRCLPENPQKGASPFRVRTNDP